MIADQHDFGVDPGGVVEDTSAGSGADHPGFVDNQHGPGREATMGRVVQLDQQTGDRLGGDARGGLEFAGGSCRERRAEHTVTGVLPGVASGIKRERFAGPGRGDHHVDAIATGGELHDEVDLLGGQLGPPSQRVEHELLVDTRDVAVAAFEGLVDESLFEGDQLNRGVPRPERRTFD